MKTAPSEKLRLSGAILALALCLSPGAWQSSLAGEAPLEGWSSISLKGRKFLFAVGRSRIERWPAAEAEGPELIRLVSSASALGAPISRHQVLSLSRPADGGTARWLAWTEGKRARLAERRDGAELLVTTFRPGEGASEIPPNGWTRAKQRVVALTGSGEEDPGSVLDTATRLAHLGELVQRERGEFLLLTRKGVSRLEFRVAGNRSVRRRLMNLDTGLRDWITLKVAVIHLEPSDVGGDTLLGMEGVTKLWVDVDSGALVRISGRRKGGGGRLSLELVSYSQIPEARPEMP